MEVIVGGAGDDIIDIPDEDNAPSRTMEYRKGRDDKIPPRPLGPARPGDDSRGVNMEEEKSGDEESGNGKEGADPSKPPPSDHPAAETGGSAFDQSRENLRPREGGYADRPLSEDPGGPTQKGISQKELDNLRQREEWQHLPASSKDLSDKQIDAIYREEYHDPLHIDKLSEVPGLKEAAPHLADQVFDAGVHHGITDSGRWLQEALDEELGTDLRKARKDGSKIYDGIVGPKTRDTVARVVREGKIESVNNRIVDKRVEYMRSLTNFDANDNGWIRRAESFRIGRKR